MNVLPIWQPALAAVPKQPDVENLFAVPRSASFYGGEIVVVYTGEQAEAMLQLAMERPCSHIGFDTEYGYARPPVLRGKGKHYDVRSVEPKLLSFALVEPTPQGEVIYRFVVVLGDPAILSPLAQFLRLPILFCAHFSKGDLFCLWQLGLPAPRKLWDSCVCEKGLYLGHEHVRYKVVIKDDVAAEIDAKEAVETTARLRYSLIDTCRRYDVAVPMAEQKGVLQHSFLDHRAGDPFSGEQIAYAAEDAVAVAKLYPRQVHAAAQSGILSHLLEVEHPWTVTMARTEWTGLLVDDALAEKIRQECADRLPQLQQQLEGYGLKNANSNPQVRDFFAKLGLLHLFAGRDGEKFEKSLLKRYADRHPAIPLIIEYRQMRSLLADGILDSTLKGADGRYHPEHRQLGTHTGRQTSKNPNILGLPRSMRPLVIPEDGSGIGEVDLCQIEVGVTAAVYGDDALVRLFNSGDVYSAMAQLFYADDLPGEAVELGGSAFKTAYPELRNTMKTATLAMIYGTGVEGLASQLGVSKRSAQQLLVRFLGLFPALATAKARGANCSARRGYAETVSGLRRYRGLSGRATGWERRWLVNFPVQGSAAVAFKMAGNRLDRLYPAYGARLLIPMHDAFIFVAPRHVLKEVAELTARIMCESVQEYFPQLRPRADINIRCPERWNKDGNFAVLEREADSSE